MTTMGDFLAEAVKDYIALTNAADAMKTETFVLDDIGEDAIKEEEILRLYESYQANMKAAFVSKVKEIHENLKSNEP
jgi:hypothetical protein